MIYLRTLVILFFLSFVCVYTQVINSIQFEGVHSVQSENLRALLKSRWSALPDSQLLNQDCLAITTYYQDEGFLEASCSFYFKSASKTNSVAVYFRILEGPLYRFGTIEISGLESVHPFFIASLSDFSSGMPFSKTRILNSQIKAMQTGLFEDFEIKAKEVEPFDREISVQINVKEKAGSALDLGVGFDSEDGAKLFSEWRKRNLNGKGRSLAIDGLFSVNYDRSLYFKKGTAGLALREPFIFSLPFNAGIYFKFISDKPNLVNFGYQSYSAEAFLDYPISLQYHLVFKSKLQNATLFNIPFTDEDRNFEDEFQIDNNRFVSLMLTRDTRDDLVDPSSGSYASLLLEQAGGIFGGDNDYTKLYLLGSLYANVRRRVVLAQQVAAGSIELNTAIESFPSYLRFFLGGTGSIRGFAQRSLGPRKTDGSAAGGNFFLLSNSELRYYLNYNFSIVAFVDAGNIWLERSKAKFSSLNISSGAGVRWRTRFGFFRLDIGLRLTQFSNSDYGRIHFGFGQNF